MAGRPEIVEEVRGAVDAVRVWLAREISELLNQPDFDYALQGALPDAVRIPAFRREVLDRFRAIGAMG